MNAVISFLVRLGCVALTIMAIAILGFPEIRHGMLREILKIVFLSCGAVIMVRAWKMGHPRTPMHALPTEIRKSGRVTGGTFESAAFCLAFVALLISGLF